MTCEKVWEFIHPDSLYSSVSSVLLLINFGNLKVLICQYILYIESKNKYSSISIIARL